MGEGAHEGRTRVGSAETPDQAGDPGQAGGPDRAGDPDRAEHREWKRKWSEQIRTVQERIRTEPSSPQVLREVLAIYRQLTGEPGSPVGLLRKILREGGISESRSRQLAWLVDQLAEHPNPDTVEKLLRLPFAHARAILGTGKPDEWVDAALRPVSKEKKRPGPRGGEPEPPDRKQGEFESLRVLEARIRAQRSATSGEGPNVRSRPATPRRGLRCACGKPIPAGTAIRMRLVGDPNLLAFCGPQCVRAFFPTRRKCRSVLFRKKGPGSAGEAPS
jgi:hypothetical protein